MTILGELRRIKSFRRKSAEDDSCRVFGRNLRALLLQNPKRCKNILSVDPGFTNGCKCAVIDIHGEPKETFKVFLNRRVEMKKKLKSSIETFSIDSIAIGDGKGRGWKTTNYWEHSSFQGCLCTAIPLNM